jgi:hypothetical protein
MLKSISRRLDAAQERFDDLREPVRFLVAFALAGGWLLPAAVADATGRLPRDGSWQSDALLAASVALLLVTVVLVGHRLTWMQRP